MCEFTVYRARVYVLANLLRHLDPLFYKTHTIDIDTKRILKLSNICTIIVFFAVTNLIADYRLRILFFRF